MKEKPSLWTDLLLVLVVVRFLSDLLVKSVISATQFTFFALALFAIIILRSRFSFAESALRTGLSVTGIALFFVDTYFTVGAGAALAFVVLFGLLLLVYFFLRGATGLFGLH